MSNITANKTTVVTQSTIQAQATQAYEFFSGGRFATMNNRDIFHRCNDLN